MKRNFLKWILSSFITATFLFLIIGSSWALPLPATISIDPLKTYLRTDFPTDKVPASSVIELNSFGINPGDYIRLEQLGFYKRGVASADDFNEMIGVFSTSDLIAPPSKS
ncbi:MAG: hypothetical protein HND49_20030 [Planctomycetes bacterium]|nr:hypothetical protein [Planctomycetota bacterium]